MNSDRIYVFGKVIPSITGSGAVVDDVEVTCVEFL